MNAAELARIANERRVDAVEMIHRAGTGHVGGTLSSLDIITCLYYDVMRVFPDAPDTPGRDRFVLSKGHSVEGYLTVLADRGFFDPAELATFSQAGTRLIGHPSNKVPGVEICSGALGHGLPVGVGMALAAKRTAMPYRTYVLMGDGELAEGSVWEAAMAAANYRLDTLFAIVDRNGLQISGPTEQVMALEALPAKWRAFGWDVCEADGHDMEALQAYFRSDRPAGMPHCLIAHTVKAKGLPGAENKKEWHHRVPDREAVQACHAALEVKEVSWLA